MRFHHVGLTVSDLEAAVAFYRDVLGFTPGYAFEVPPIGLRGRFMAAPCGVSVELMERAGSVPGPDRSQPPLALGVHGYGHFCLEVAAVEPVFAELVGRGAAAVWAPRPSPEPGVRMAFVADPDGNLIELIARPDGVS